MAWHSWLSPGGAIRCTLSRQAAPILRLETMPRLDASGMTMSGKAGWKAGPPRRHSCRGRGGGQGRVRGRPGNTEHARHFRAGPVRRSPPEAVSVPFVPVCGAALKPFTGSNSMSRLCRRAAASGRYFCSLNIEVQTTTECRKRHVAGRLERPVRIHLFLQLHCFATNWRR